MHKRIFYHRDLTVVGAAISKNGLLYDECLYIRGPHQAVSKKLKSLKSFRLLATWPRIIVLGFVVQLKCILDG